MKPIPEAAFREAVAVLGRTGSGKTFAAKGVIEDLIGRGERVCIIDPTGVWWGLRSSPDGSKAMFSVAVFGGLHADVPIGEESAAPLADILAARNLPAVVDLSEFGTNSRTRFMTRFLEQLYAKNREPLTVVFDEADMFAPQRPMPEETVLSNRMETIVRRGRVRGFRPWLITQRPAVLHKNVLSQASTLIAMKLTSPQDRAAIGAWIEGQADRDAGKELLATLPKLPPGEGFVWCPAVDYLERVKFPAIRTFDSGKTPEHGDSVQQPAQLADVDLSGVIEALKVEEPQRKAPKRIEIVDEEAVYRRGRAEGYRAAMEAVRLALDVPLQRVEELARDVRADLEKIAPQQSHAPAPEKPRANNPDLRTKNADLRQPHPVVRGNGAAHRVHLPEGERSILLALAQHRSSGCSREQLSVLTAYKRSSRDKYVQRLKQAGFAEVRGDLIFPTQAGVAALGSDYEPLPTGKALREHWLARLPAGESLLLELVASKYPHAADREWLSQKSELKRSSRDKYIQHLSARKLVTITGRGELRASADLFDA